MEIPYKIKIKGACFFEKHNQNFHIFAVVYSNISFLFSYICRSNR